MANQPYTGSSNSRLVSFQLCTQRNSLSGPGGRWIRSTSRSFTNRATVENSRFWFCLALHGRALQIPTPMNRGCSALISRGTPRPQ